MDYKQGHPDPAHRELIFHMSKADGTPDTGLAFVAGNLKFRKPRAFGAAANSSAYANVDGTQLAAVVELGGGDYVYTFTAAEHAVPGKGAFQAQKGTGLFWTDRIDIARAYIGVIVAGTLGASAFTTDRAEATANYWKDCLITFVTGNLAGQTKKIGASAGGANQLITLATGLAFTGAPAAGDIYEILTR